MKGHWQKEVPVQSGLYWVADLNKRVGSPQVVQYTMDGTLVFAVGPVRDGYVPWDGWWWSEPIEEPSPPVYEKEAT